MGSALFFEFGPRLGEAQETGAAETNPRAVTSRVPSTPRDSCGGSHPPPFRVSGHREFAVGRVAIETAHHAIHQDHDGRWQFAFLDRSVSAERCSDRQGEDRGQREASRRLDRNRRGRPHRPCARAGRSRPATPAPRSSRFTRCRRRSCVTVEKSPPGKNRAGLRGIRLASRSEAGAQADRVVPRVVRAVAHVGLAD